MGKNKNRFIKPPSIKEKGKIPYFSSQLPIKDKELESIPFLISFKCYDDKECPIDKVDKAKVRKTLEIIKNIGKEMYDEQDIQERYHSSPVGDSHEYQKLYNGLDKQEDLKEITTGYSDRLFYFLNKPEKKFYIRGITSKHLESEKQRRKR